MANHVVKIGIGRKGKFGYTRWHVLAGRGDTIKWKLANNYPYAIVMKASATPFAWMVKAAGKGKWIEGKSGPTPRPDAIPTAPGRTTGTACWSTTRRSSSSRRRAVGRAENADSAGVNLGTQ